MAKTLVPSPLLADLIERLQGSSGLAVTSLPQAWEIVVPKADGIEFRITVPHEALEWFVEAKRDGAVLWSDWVDYYATDGEVREMLLAEMAEEIEAFVTQLHASEVRLAAPDASSRAALEYRRGETWKPLAFGAAPGA